MTEKLRAQIRGVSNQHHPQKPTQQAKVVDKGNVPGNVWDAEKQAKNNAKNV